MSKIEETMTLLSSLVNSASKAAEENKSVRELHSLAVKFVSGCESIITAEGFDASKVGSVGQALGVALENASRVATGLSVASGSDRDAGDKAARALTMAVDANWLEGDEADKATALVGQWNATAPKGRASKGTGTGSTTSGAPLPFPVKVTCEHDGWSATQSTTLNSVRWAAILHHADKHGSKPSKGTPIHQGLTEALVSVTGYNTETKTFETPKSHSAQGGGYIVDKASA